MAGHLFGYEAALAIDASARPAARGARRDRGACSPRPAWTAPTTCWSGSRPSSRRPATRFLDGLRSGVVRRSPRGRAPRCGWRRCCATPPASRPSTRTRSSYGKVGTPSTVVEDLTAALTSGDRGAHPAGRRDQAPGEDRHGRHLPFRRDAAAGAARARGARRRRGPRQPQLPRAAHARRPRPRGRRRSSASPATGSRVTSPATTARSTWSTGAACAATLRSRTDDEPTASAARSTASRPSGRSRWRVGRRDGRTLVIVPEVKGNQTIGLTLLHVRFHDRLRARRRPAASSRATAAATPRCRTPSPRPSRRSTTPASPTSTSSTCSRSPSTCWPTAGANGPAPRRSSGSARTSSRSSGSGSRCSAGPRLPERLFSDDERAYAFRHRDPRPASRRASAPRRR